MIEACWDANRLKRMPAWRCMEVLGKLLVRLDREAADREAALRRIIPDAQVLPPKQRRSGLG
jgi:hypothetical protein